MLVCKNIRMPTRKNLVNDVGRKGLRWDWLKKGKQVRWVWETGNWDNKESLRTSGGQMKHGRRRRLSKQGSRCAVDKSWSWMLSQGTTRGGSEDVAFLCMDCKIWFWLRKVDYPTTTVSRVRRTTQSNREEMDDDYPQPDLPHFPFNKSCNCKIKLSVFTPLSLIWPEIFLQRTYAVSTLSFSQDSPDFLTYKHIETTTNKLRCMKCLPSFTQKERDYNDIYVYPSLCPSHLFLFLSCP